MAPSHCYPAPPITPLAETTAPPSPLPFPPALPPQTTKTLCSTAPFVLRFLKPLDEYRPRGIADISHSRLEALLRPRHDDRDIRHAM